MQVIVFQCTITLHIGIAAMVISQQQALGRNQFGSAAAAKEDDSVLHAVMVHTVDILGCKFEAQLLHFSLVIIQKNRQPHSLVGTGPSENAAEKKQ